jgi:hypothetical protein
LPGRIVWQFFVIWRNNTDAQPEPPLRLFLSCRAWATGSPRAVLDPEVIVVAHKVARTLFVCLLLGLGMGLIGSPLPGSLAPASNWLWAAPSHPGAERVVFLAGGLGDEDVILLTANVAASRHPGLVLLYTPQTKASQKHFLQAYQPSNVVPVGTFADGLTDVERNLGRRVGPVMPWTNGPSVALWETLFPQADHVVICPAQPRRLLLQAACLAGVVRAPLLVTHGRTEEKLVIRECLEAWQTRRATVLGDAISTCRYLPNVKVATLKNEDAVAAAALRHLIKKSTIRNLVIANPGDVKPGQATMSALAPWIALQRRAPLLLTNTAGNNIAALVDKLLQNPDLAKVDTLILAADLKAIPMEQRPNPMAGKDVNIEMEPLTPTGTDPFTFATGRLFHEDPGVVLQMLARQRLLTSAAARKALVVSNPGGGLPLLETFSRSTAKELYNGGYQTAAMLGSEVNKDDLRRLLPEQDIFLWEGHFSTLRDYGLADWDEPLRPSLVFLQSCLALQESKALPFLQRGALGVVGSSTRTYSGSGGACSLAFFNALLYEGQSLGGSLRQAKNFLLAYSLLKEKRLGQNAKMTGANVRSAWAFTLWGDPTLKLPRPDQPEEALAPVRHQVHGNTIVVSLPEVAHDGTISGRFKAQIPPNGRLAGLVTKTVEEGQQRLVPFLFAEVSLPRAPAGKTPRLSSRLPSSHYVFCWDKWRRCGYLLITPRSKDLEEIRFHIDWDGPLMIGAE